MSDALVPIEVSIVGTEPVANLKDCTRVKIRCLLRETHGSRVQDHELMLRLLVRLPPETPSAALEQAAREKAEKLIRRLITVASVK